MARINLIPVELAPKTNIVKVVTQLRRFTIIGLVLVVFVSIGMAIFIIYYLVQTNITTTANKKLETNIASLETTEQKLVLVKDRLKKAQEILQSDTSQKNLNSIFSVVNNMPSDIIVSELDETPDKWSLSFTTKNPSSLTNFMSSLIVNSSSKKIDLQSFSYSGSAGYSVSLDFF